MPVTDQSAATSDARESVREPRGLRVAALAGVATLPLALAAGTLSDPNSVASVDPGTDPTELVRVLVEMRDDQVLASTLHALAAVSLWAFLGPLWARVRRGSGPLAVVAVVGGVMASTPSACVAPSSSACRRRS